MSLYLISLILGFHFVADFVLQSHWMAIGKSKRWGMNLNMASHIAVYTAFLLPLGPTWALANGVAHYATDIVSSRGTTALWKRQQIHWFFVVIGADQLVHVLCLLWSYQWLQP
jgi:hypothetical protein